MTDWKAIARARGIPVSDIDRIAAALSGLEETLRPLVQDLPPELEPATEMRIEEEGE
jgi:hypothetical protein